MTCLFLIAVATAFCISPMTRSPVWWFPADVDFDLCGQGAWRMCSTIPCGCLIILGPRGGRTASMMLNAGLHGTVAGAFHHQVRLSAFHEGFPLYLKMYNDLGMRSRHRRMVECFPIPTGTPRIWTRFPPGGKEGPFPRVPLKSHGWHLSAS